MTIQDVSQIPTRRIRSLPPGEYRSRVVEAYEQLAEERDYWIAKNRFYYGEHFKYIRSLVPEGMRVLEVGCGTGQLLAALEPSRGLGVDASEGMVRQASERYPHLRFLAGDVELESTLKEVDEEFDYIVISDTIGYLVDCQRTFELLRRFCRPETRIVVSYYSWLWEPVLKLAELLGQKMPQPQMNWLSTDTISDLLALADYQVIKREWRQLVPRRLFGVGTLINRYVATLPLVRRFCLRNYVVARPLFAHGGSTPEPSVSVVVPCRNEAGNIESAVRRIPDFADDLEIVFVEGNSQDNTLEEIQRVISAYPNKNIRMLRQDGIGKWDAVSKAFDAAEKDVLMILDADLTVPPEELPKFYDAIASGKGEFINGSRMVYPMENEAMRFLNYWANAAFSFLFTWILNQRYTDTLCGTKVLLKRDYEKLKARHAELAEIDPFGDFFLIFGAQKENLKTVEIPIRYAARDYGETQISRFRHGLLLLRMVVFAYRRFKAF